MATHALARVFGEAYLKVEVDEKGRPVVGLASHGYRGFELWCRGAHGEFLPDLLSRRCGVDSVYHRMGACIALERALGVEIPEGAKKARELLLACQLFRRHSLTMTLHVLPDLLFPASDLGLRNLVGLFRVDRDVVGRMMALNAWGESAMRRIAGRAVHPVLPVPGGLTAYPEEEALKGLRNSLSEVMGLARETSRLVRMLLRRNEDLVGELGKYPAIPLAAVTPPFGGSWGGIRMAGERGGVGEVQEEDLLERVEMVSWRDSLLEVCRLPGQESGVLTGPLSRVNLTGSYGSELADTELEELKKYWGFPLRGMLLSHALRLAEMIMALERIDQLLAEAASWSGGETRRVIPPGIGAAWAALEGAEGLHLYRVEVEGGHISEVGYLSPLHWNLPGLLEVVQEEAQRAVGDVSEARQLGRLGVAIRCYAPCFFCASG
jgi:F420-non-reducing hydrogenase large subunit